MPAKRLRNIKLTMQYDGTGYAGWQYQKNARSVQGTVLAALKKVLCGEKVNLIGSGRTDAGVHARGQVANFKTRSRLPLENIQMALNSYLPKDIVVARAEAAPPGFDAQRDARHKLYRYTVANGSFVDPLIRHAAAKYFYALDVGVMRGEARSLVGRHDFRAFKRVDGDDTKDTVRTVRKIQIKKEGRLLYIDIEADGFLYSMARSIVGTLIEAGRGKYRAGSVKEILKSGQRRRSGPTAPAKGLCLVKVTY